jgi:DNA-directed RNA polymerase specialized sigma24 family protein
MSEVREFSGFTRGGTEKDKGSQNPHPVAEDATRMGQPQFEDFELADCEWESLLAEARRILRDDGEEDAGEEWCPEHEQGERLAKVDEEARQRRIYRGRTVAMLRRYMRYSIETGRLPSILGREFFRAKVTSYTVVTFEDRVIFVHDMERCLDRLDEFSRQLIARHILQEHDQAATGRLLNCTERTVRTWVPLALDLLAEILVEVGLLEPGTRNGKNPVKGVLNHKTL